MDSYWRVRHFIGEIVFNGNRVVENLSNPITSLQTFTTFRNSAFSVAFRAVTSFEANTMLSARITSIGRHHRHHLDTKTIRPELE